MWLPMRRAPAPPSARPAHVELAARRPTKSPMTAHERADLVLAFAKSLYVNPGALGQGQAAAPRPDCTRRYWQWLSLARCVGDDAKLNKVCRRQCHPLGHCGRLPRRSPIVQQALRDAVPARNHQNPAALSFHFGHQRRLFFRRPLPAAQNHNLPIHSSRSFWTVQKDQVSFRALFSTTRSRTVQTGRLRIISPLDGRLFR
jgi:hypothetical protein